MDKYRNVKSRESHSLTSNKAISRLLMCTVTLLHTTLFFKIEEGASLCRCQLQTVQFEKQLLFTKYSNTNRQLYPFLHFPPVNRDSKTKWHEMQQQPPRTLRTYNHISCILSIKAPQHIHLTKLQKMYFRL